MLLSFFFFNDTATTEIYTLSLHDALPISLSPTSTVSPAKAPSMKMSPWEKWITSSTPKKSVDRKSTRLNSSHSQISYAVFCLKKKNNAKRDTHTTYTAFLHPARPSPTWVR